MSKKLLTEYHEMLENLVKTEFGDLVKTVESYTPDDNDADGMHIKTPAVLIEVERMSEAPDKGDGTDAIDCSVSLHCILSTAKTERVELELRNFAANVLQVVKRKAYKCENFSGGRPEHIDAMPGTFRSKAHGYDSWSVSFSQVVNIGEIEWLGVDAEEIYFSFSPDIGSAHIDDYKKLGDG